MTLLTQARLKELLFYDAGIGVFTWRPRWGRGGCLTPYVAGTLNPEGYRRIQIDGLIYQASNLAWLYVTGEWPSRQLDHRNLNPSDDRFSNLRLATQTQNKANSGLYRNNKLGVKGVRLHRNGRYEARIRVDGKLIYLGCRKTIEDAKT